MSKASSRRAVLVACLTLAVGAFPVMAQSEEGALPEGVSAYDGAEPGSGEGLRIGYISLGDSIPFVNLVSQSLAAEAEKNDVMAGQDRVVERRDDRPVVAVDAGEGLFARADLAQQVLAKLVLDGALAPTRRAELSERRGSSHRVRPPDRG